MVLSFRQHCVLMIFLLYAATASASGISDMRVEYASEPIGIDAEQPRFSWKMTTDSRRHGQRQKAWRITVGSEDGSQMWDSGRQEDGNSINIAYGGKTLQPATRYTWTLTVWDDRGHSSASKSSFETGLMSHEGWAGAKWIGGGADDIPVYAQYLPVFRLSFTVQPDSASGCRKAALVYGANDSRLMSADKNILGVAAGHDKSYIKVELDVSSDTARLNVYRAGYSASDNPDVPRHSFVIPQEIISTAGKYKPHTVSLSSVLGTTRFYIGTPAKEIGRAELNPMGRGGDFIAFPVMGDYGFTVSGGKAVFTGVQLSNYRSPGNVIATLASDTAVTASGAVTTTPVTVKSSPMLRTEFRASKEIRKARLYVTARGTYRFYINGSRVGDGWLTPGFTQYNKTHHYQTYDVTALVRKGGNAMGAVLSEGWWSGGMTYTGDNWNFFGDRQSLLAKLVVTYSDGTSLTVGTSPQTWKLFAGGPQLCGSLFQGEVYDARKESAVDGWSSPGYDAAAWTQAEAVPLAGTVSATGSPDCPRPDDYSDWQLTGQNDNTVRAVDTLTAVSVEQPRPGVYVYDMGQNMAGVPEIRLHGLRPGTKVTLRFAEVKYPDLPRYAGNTGMIMLENIRAAMAQDIYIARGGNEVFAPHFTYHGYRYVEITGTGGPLPVEDVRGIVLSSVHGFTAGYETSDSAVNRLWENIRWSMRANFFSVPTDCPQRNERMGWAGDISVFAPTAAYMACVPQFLRNYVQAMRDVQRPDGKFLDIAPTGGGFGGILWGSAGLTVPWQSYLQYGDSAALAENYDAMRRYIDFILGSTIDRATGIIVQQKAWGDLADWLGPEDNSNDRSLLWEAYFIHDLDIMTRTAAVLGQTADSARYSRLAAERRAFFNRTYIQPGTARTVWSDFDPKRRGQLVDTQTSYVLPLAFGIVPDSLSARFSANLAETVTRERDGYGSCPLLTGFIGTAWISKTLSDMGRTDLAYRLLLNRDYPSWLYPVTQGATTIWERLNSYTHKDGFGKNNRMNSFNHYSFGAVGDWMMSRSLGIESDGTAPGFRRFVLRPEPDPTGQLTFAKGYYDSMYGRIESSWRREAGQTVYEFTVPANTSATVMLRADRLRKRSKGMRILSKKDGMITMILESGNYKITTE